MHAPHAHAHANANATAAALPASPTPSIHELLTTGPTVVLEGSNRPPPHALSAHRRNLSLLAKHKMPTELAAGPLATVGKAQPIHSVSAGVDEQAAVEAYWQARDDKKALLRARQELLDRRREKDHGPLHSRGFRL